MKALAWSSKALCIGNALSSSRSRIVFESVLMWWIELVAMSPPAAVAVPRWPRRARARCNRHERLELRLPAGEVPFQELERCPPAGEVPFQGLERRPGAGGGAIPRA